MSTIRTRGLLTAVLSAFCLIPTLDTRGPTSPRRPRKRPARSRRGSGPRDDLPASRPFTSARNSRSTPGRARAKLVGSCDNQMTIYLNGERVAEGKDWQTPTFADVTTHDHARAERAGGRGEERRRTAPACSCASAFESNRKPLAPVVTDGSWRLSEASSKGWQAAGFNASAWAAATVVGALGAAPWSRDQRHGAGEGRPAARAPGHADRPAQDRQGTSRSTCSTPSPGTSRARGSA